MDSSEDDKKTTQPEAGSLEGPSIGDDNDSPSQGASLEGDSAGSDEPSSSPEPTPQKEQSNSTPSDKKPAKGSGNKKPNDEASLGKVKKLVKRFDIYFLSFVLITAIAFIIAGVVLSRNNAQKPGQTTANQTLSDSAISQLNSNDTNVGGSQQTLNIASNTVFASGVLVKGNMEVAGALKITSSLSLPGITVSGTTSLDQVNASNLTLSGSETVNGSLTVKQNITAGGSGSFGGNLSAPQISVSTLQVNGPIQVAHHITSTGSIVRSSNVSLGGGGTATVNGNDTAGTININTGSGISGNNCLTTISYSQSYGSTPHVVVTPVGSAAGSSQFYIANSSGSSFTLCADNTPTSASFSFNYFVID